MFYHLPGRLLYVLCMEKWHEISCLFFSDQLFGCKLSEMQQWSDRGHQASLRGEMILTSSVLDDWNTSVSKFQEVTNSFLGAIKSWRHTLTARVFLRYVLSTGMHRSLCSDQRLCTQENLDSQGIYGDLKKSGNFASSVQLKSAKLARIKSEWKFCLRVRKSQGIEKFLSQEKGKMSCKVKELES